MGLVRWLTKPGADTREPSHLLAPLVLPVPPEQAAERFRKAVATLPGWKVESDSQSEFRLTRRSGLFGFVSAVVVSLKAAGPGTMIHATSRCRICRPGQNRRNILELFDALRRT